MLPKPVTALALSALMSIATFTASPAVAASASFSESTTAAAAPAAPKAGVHTKKKAHSKTHKKNAPLASLHSAEPKATPHGAKESPKLAASLSTKLDLKKASVKSGHAGSSKKTTLAATGKEVFIGGPTGHKGAASGSGGKVHGKVAISTVAPLHTSKGGAFAKSGRSPSRPVVAMKTEVDPSGADDHPPVLVVARSAPAAPCLRDPIEFIRGGETDRFAMTRCDGAVAPLATERLSVLARPENVAHPVSITELAKVKGNELAPGVHRIDPGLVARVQLIADHFAKPGMPSRVSIVSGYRPMSTGSFHASAQALDFHLEGVPNDAVVEYCKTLDNTGCGFYPNSSFVHVDVRAPGTGHVAWIDTSGPGEPPNYVTSWPPPPETVVKMAKEEELPLNPYNDALPPLPGKGRDGREPEEIKAPAASITPLNLKNWEY